MGELYGDSHRRLQDERGSRRLADRLAAMAHAAFADDERAFIESCALFFLSTVDEHGRPTVSHKGGAPGFVRVTDDGALLFPSYDGNGMFLSLGNIAATTQVGLLFIDFERPHRLRVQGTARLLPADPAAFPGAQYLVEVRPIDIFVNCGRYIHRAETVTLSKHVPAADGSQPFPEWKRLDLFDGALTVEDMGKVDAAGGGIAIQEYRGEA